MAGSALNETLKKTISSCLFFQLAVVPLIIDPFSYEWWYGPKIVSAYALVLITLTAAAVLKLRGGLRIARPHASLLFFLALFAASGIISTTRSVDATLSLKGDLIRHESLATLLAYPLLCFLFATLVRTEGLARGLLLGLALCTAAASAYALIQYAGLDPVVLKPYFGKELLPGTKAVGSTLGNANFLGKFLVLTSPLLLAQLCLSECPGRQLAWALALLTAVAALITTETRASWFGFLIASGLFMVFMRRTRFMRKIMHAAAGAAAGALICIAVVAQASGKLPDLKSTMLLRVSEALHLMADMPAMARTPRYFLWSKGADLIAQRPWFGYGPDTQVKIMRKYNFEYNSRFDDNVELDKVHNNYLDLAITQGFFGLFAYCGILASCLSALWRSLQRTDGRERIILSAVFSGLCGYVLNDIFSFSVVSVSPVLWSLMGLSFAIPRAYAAAETRKP